MTTPTSINPRNRHNADYRAEARRLGPPAVPIIDAHAHINGEGASAVWLEAADAFGIQRVYTQTLIEQAGVVSRTLGERARFVAVPRFGSEDRAHGFTQGFLEDLTRWREEFDARVVKLWNAPRLVDFLEEQGWRVPREEIVPFDGAWRMRIAEKAVDLGMMLMVHIADPDTWFRTKYKDASRYGTKADQYPSLERLLNAFPDTPLLGAHMLGWPEDLDFLDGMLDRHPNLILDCSATKWMIRELSKHPRERLIAFMDRWRGRVLFGSDIVTSDKHLEPSPESDRAFAADLASTREEAFELYASRYWAYRTMLETDYEGESNIADPDLAMEHPDRFGPTDAALLVGKSLPEATLGTLYQGAAEATMERWFARD